MVRLASSFIKSIITVSSITTGLRWGSRRRRSGTTRRSGWLVYAAAEEEIRIRSKTLGIRTPMIGG
ncbi:hypothetical protein LINPERHAP1_LOCUS20396 [Linum perenne]